MARMGGGGADRVGTAHPAQVALQGVVHLFVSLLGCDVQLAVCEVPRIGAEHGRGVTCFASGGRGHPGSVKLRGVEIVQAQWDGDRWMWYPRVRGQNTGIAPPHRRVAGRGENWLARGGGGGRGSPPKEGGGGSSNGALVTEPLVKYQSPRREVVRSSAGVGVAYPPFGGSFT